MLAVDEEKKLFKSKAIYVASICLSSIAIGLFLYFSFDLLLLVFAAILVAIFFRGIAEFISSKIPISPKVSLLILMLFLTALWYGIIHFSAPSINKQIAEFRDAIPSAVAQSRDWLSQYAWGEKIISGTSMDDFLNKGNYGAVTRATGAVSGLAQGIVNILIIFIIGIYMAFSPNVYTQGILKLFPIQKRGRIQEVLSKIYKSLQWWLIGRFIDMAFIGFLIWGGLAFLDIPMAFVLALIAAVLNFIPNLGPFLGAVPALLIAFTRGPETTLYVAILFFVIQSLETAFVTPMVQQKAIHLPPALTISSQILLGTAFGSLGLAVATPLVAALMIIIQMLYIHDTLEAPKIA